MNRSTETGLQEKLHDLVGTLLSLEAEAKSLSVEWAGVANQLHLARIKVVKAVRQHEPAMKKEGEERVV